MRLNSRGLLLATGLAAALHATPAAGQEGGPAAAAGGPEAMASPGREQYPDLASFSALYQPYIAGLSAYEPIYFLAGMDPEESKFQISLKYRFFNPEGSLRSRYPWLKGFHLGYTQTSFWDLSSDSAPFDDTSYKPELFFLSGNIGLRPSWLQGLFLQTGFQHESNGQGDDLSRSTNFLYAEPMAVFYDPDTRLGLLLRVRGWAYVNNDETNADLADYRGYYRVEGKFGLADGWVLGSAIWWGDEGLSGQADLTYPIHRLFQENFNFYFQVQYVDALAESLLHYQERDRALRLGLAIVR